MQTPRRNADKVTASSLARYVPSHTAFARGLPICIHLSFRCAPLEGEMDAYGGKLHSFSFFHRSF